MAGPALTILREAAELKEECGAAEALQFVWQEFDQHFQSTKTSTENLLQKLLEGPTVHFTDQHSLLSFSTICHAANLRLQKGNQDLLILNRENTQDKIQRRLDNKLEEKWLETCRRYLKCHDQVPFAVFALSLIHI